MRVRVFLHTFASRSSCRSIMMIGDLKVDDVNQYNETMKQLQLQYTHTHSPHIVASL